MLKPLSSPFPNQNHHHHHHQQQKKQKKNKKNNKNNKNNKNKVLSSVVVSSTPEGELAITGHLPDIPENGYSAKISARADKGQGMPSLVIENWHYQVYCIQIYICVAYLYINICLCGVCDKGQGMLFGY